MPEPSPLPSRAELIARMRHQVEEIDLFFNSVAHYNRIHPDEPPIEADPDGTLAAYRAAFTETLAKEAADA